MVAVVGRQFQSAVGWSTPKEKRFVSRFGLAVRRLGVKTDLKKKFFNNHSLASLMMMLCMN